MTEQPEPFGALPLGRFAERLASAEPVPGGGSASAVAASLAAALLEMVARLSQDRPKYAAYAATIARAASAGAEARTRFLTLADEDAAAYAGFAAALKLPRDGEEAQAHRRHALSTAAREASRVPLEMVRLCRTVVGEVEALAGRSNLNASSDLAVAALLAEAAARGAGANVMVNLPSVEDPEFVGAMTSELDGHLEAIRHLARRTRERVGEGELREPEQA